MHNPNKPLIGISCGDLNGVGPEVIIKTLSDNRILELCTPVIFASAKVLNFYRKVLPEHNFNYQTIREISRPNQRQVNLVPCWEEDVMIQPGQLSESAGKYAIASLMAATEALQKKEINGLVTAPIHKKNIQSDNFPFTGHTPFLKASFQAREVLMILFSHDLRVALVTEHLPLGDVAKNITRELVSSKIQLLHDSLRRDFGIDKPRIAVLGLNPHAGDEGLIGKEEENIIRPAVKDAKQQNMLVTGPFSADAFFARGYQQRFDAVLAMYHDQGLIPFKALAAGEGVNYTAGLPAVRTSPDHGTAFDIAGKGTVDENSFRLALFECIDIINRRIDFSENRKNPLRKRTAEMLRNAVDETISE